MEESIDLHTLLKKNPDATKVGRLIVRNSLSPGRGSEHNRGLLHVCSRYNVRWITFMTTTIWVEERSFLGILAKEDRGPKCFLPCLKRIDVECDADWNPVFYYLVRNSRVKMLCFYLIDHDNDRDAYRHAIRILDYLCCDGVLKQNYSITDISISWDEAGYTVDCLDDLVVNRKAKELYAIFRRNEDGLRKCEKAVTILLGLSKLRKSSCFLFSHRDAMTIVISMVWETRDIKGWSDW